MYPYYQQMQPFSYYSNENPYISHPDFPYSYLHPTQLQQLMHLQQPIHRPTSYHYQFTPTQQMLYGFHQQPSWLSSFKNPQGGFDFQKTFQTVDQVIKTVNQVSPLVKQFSSLFTLPK